MIDMPAMDVVGPAGHWAEGLSEPLFAALERAAAAFPERPAIDFLGRLTSWRGLLHDVERLARGLAAIGVRKGDRVGLLLPNTPYYVISYYAVTRLGAVVVNLNPLYAEQEVARLLADSQARVVISIDLELTLPKVLPCIGKSGLERVVVCSMVDALPRTLGIAFNLFQRSELATVPEGAGCLSYARVLDIGSDAALPEVAIDPKVDLAVLQYTGGTTGEPKGAMLTHCNLVTNAAQISAWYGPEQAGADQVLGVLPLFHVFAMTVVMNLSVRIAATMILLPRFKLEQVLETIHKRRPTIFPAVPTIYNTIDKADDVGRYDLSSLRFCISGGAALPLEVKAGFESRTGCTVVEGYGLSEASPVVTCNPTKGLNKPGSIGLPMPGVSVTVRDPKDPAREMAQGELGEICVSGPTVMQGYWRRPDATEAVMTDGWLRTGDIGRIDEEGYIFLVDRIKDVVVVNGYKVFPRMIEEALYEHPAIAEATVIGIDDAAHGQVPKAFIAAKPGAAIDLEELRAFLETRLSPMERPRAIEIRESLPKTMIGKLSKKELVEEERAKGRLEAKPEAVG